MLNKIHKWIRLFWNLSNKENLKYLPIYKVEEINQDEDGEFTVAIRILNKRSVFQMKPEELLANDTLVDRFSPRDIRTLTYLGYLGVNTPKYKILASRLTSEHDKIIFTLKKKGEKKLILKTAEQILSEKEILSSLNPEDSKVIGYTVATESIHEAKKQRQSLIKLK